EGQRRGGGGQVDTRTTARVRRRQRQLRHSAAGGRRREPLGPAERWSCPGLRRRPAASVTGWALWPRYLGRVPVLANRGGACQPRAQFGLRELRVAVLEPDAVGVALAKVCDQHLARVLVLPALRDLKIDLE